MKPPIEYRPKKKPKPTEAEQIAAALPKLAAKLHKHAEVIVIRRNRAKYNAYMRAYRAKKKLR